MKITIGRLRLLIQEALVQEAMKTSLDPEMRVQIEREDERSLSVRIKEVGKPKAHSNAYISLRRREIDDGGYAWEVTNSNARQGFGPLVYDLAMEYVVGKLGHSGIMADTSGNVSPAAKNVWDFYYQNRPDVGNADLPQSIYGNARFEPLKKYYFPKDGRANKLDRFEAEGLVEYLSEN